MSKEHSLARQPKTRVLAPEDAYFEEGLELAAVALPDVDPVSATNVSQINAFDEAQPGKQRVVQPLAGGKLAEMDRRGFIALDPANVRHGRRNVAPANTVARRMPPAPEPQPLAVGPVFQVVARSAPGSCHVRNLVLL